MRNFIVFGLVISALVLIPFVASAAFKDGLVLYLALDEGSGNKAGDLSGNGHDGEINESVWVDGKYKKALKFTGGQDRGSGKGTFVTVASTDALNVNEMTFMAWINAETWDGTRQIVGKSVHGGCSGRVQYGVFSAEGAFKARLSAEGGSVDVVTDLPPANEWVHLAVTNDGAKALIYINGEEVMSGDVSGKLTVNDDPWRLGQDCERENYIFSGMIDDVRLWNRALSTDEINKFKGMGAEILESGVAVEPQDKLPATWGKLKAAR
jgi:hypothetical protein